MSSPTWRCRVCGIRYPLAGDTGTGGWRYPERNLECLATLCRKCALPFALAGRLGAGPIGLRRRFVGRGRTR